MMKKILYVEDNEDTAEAVRIILKKEGYSVDLAYNAKEALEKVKRGFDLILLDIMLPDMSGLQLFDILLEQGIRSHYAFLSAIPLSSKELEKISKSGIKDYITKPFEKDDLVKRIKNIFSPEVKTAMSIIF